MIRNSLWIMVLAFASLVGCAPAMDSQWTEVEAGRVFRVSIPQNFIPADDLHDFAPLQYADEAQGFYLLGISEPKSELEKIRLSYTLPDYSWFVERRVSDGLDTSDVRRLGPVMLNGLPAERVEFSATQATEMGPMDVWYRVCVVESPTHFHQLIGWTSEERGSILAEAMEQIECSFVESGASDHAPGTEPGGAEGGG